MTRDASNGTRGISTALEVETGGWLARGVRWVTGRGWPWLILMGLWGLIVAPILTGLDHQRMPERDDDWDNQLLLWDTQRLALLEEGVLPLWNPFPEGGAPLLANPESNAAYPLYWLTLPLETQAAIRVHLALHPLIGLAGTYMAGVSLGMGPVGALFSAATFWTASVYGERMRAGHLMWMGMAWLPWLVWAARRWTGRHRALAALFLAFLYLMGAHYLTVFGGVLLVLIRLEQRLERQARWKALAGVVVGAVAAGFLGAKVGVLIWGLEVLWVGWLLGARGRRDALRTVGVLLLAACLAGVKLLPGLELWQYSVRFEARGEEVLAPDGGALKAIGRWAGVLERDPVEVHEDQPTFHQALPLVLGGVGWAVGGPAAAMPVLVTGAGLFWSLGSASPVPVSALWSPLGGDSLLRYRARAAVLSILGIALLAGLAAERLWTGAVGRRPFFGSRTREPERRILSAEDEAPPLDSLSGRTWLVTVTRALALLLLVGSVLGSERPSARAWPGVFNEPVSKKTSMARAPLEGLVRVDCERPMWEEARRARACVNAFSAVPLANARQVRASGAEGYRGELWWEEGGDGQLPAVRKRQTGAVNLTHPGAVSGQLILNQVWYPGWREESGRPIVPVAGLLGVEWRGGTEATLEYRPASVRWGALISLVGLALFLGVAREWGRGAGRSQSAAVARSATPSGATGPSGPGGAGPDPDGGGV